MGRGYEEVTRLESAHDGRSVLKSFFASKIFCIVNNDIQSGNILIRPMLTLVYRRLGADGLGRSHEET